MAAEQIDRPAEQIDLLTFDLATFEPGEDLDGPLDPGLLDGDLDPERLLGTTSGRTA